MCNELVSCLQELDLSFGQIKVSLVKSAYQENAVNRKIQRGGILLLGAHLVKLGLKHVVRLDTLRAWVFLQGFAQTTARVSH